MFKVFLCVSTQHDWRLVLLAALVCAVATLATFFLYSKVPQFPVWKRSTWLGMSGLVAGSGIWTTHFVAMLAFRTGLPTGYAPLETLGSLAVAVIGCTLGFGLASLGVADRRKTMVAVAGGLVVGVGITAMHYLGMMGYRTTGTVQWDMAYVLASASIGAVLASLALLVARPGAGRGRQAAAAGLLSLAIVGMHFTGMSAVTILPDASLVPPPSLMSDPVMIALSIVITALILVTAMGGVAFDAASRNDSLRRLREALDVMPDGLAFYDAADQLVAWNTPYADFFRAQGLILAEGMAFADLIQCNLVHGIYPEAKGREIDWLAERTAVRRGTIPSLTQRIQGGRWLRITERRTADGGTVSVCTDITDLKSAEQAISAARDKAEEEARRAEFAERQARLGHWRLDLATKAITWSSQMFAIYGLEAEAPLELDALQAMTHPDDVAERTGRLQRLHEGGGAETAIVRIIRSDGEVRHLSGTSGSERDADGNIIAIVGTLVDVTEQKLLESQLRHAQAEAEAAATVKSDFLANMSHELRTPLTSIIGFTGLAAEQADLSALTRNYIERVGDASRALLCTVNDILDFSKLEAGQVSFQPQPVDLAKLGRSTLDLFTPQAGAKDLTLTLETAGAPGLVWLDPDRIRQILLNLVSNALKFTAAGSVTLAVGYDAGAQVLQVDVVDTGAGIPAAKLDSLFKRFSQVDGSLTRAQGGTGLGLAICKGLVEAMGGEIGVDSTIGEGSRFWFRIPAPLAEGVEAEGQPTKPSRTNLDGVRVLVVDDHPANRELARLFLAGAGAEISEACDGEQGAELASQWPYDVILMDLNMPRLDGRGALRRLRQSRGPNEGTPIIAFTAAADAETNAQLAAAGFQDVVAKPLEAMALLSAVARAAAFDLEAADPEMTHVG